MGLFYCAVRGNVMKYYVQEVNSSPAMRKTADVKARVDIERVLENNGAIALKIPSIQDKRKSAPLIKKLLLHKAVANIWKDQLKILSAGDIVYFQLPIRGHSILLNSVFDELKKRKVKVIFVVHDLEVLRFALSKRFSYKQRIRIMLEEKTQLKKASAIIVHNRKMMDYAEQSLGIPREKMVSLKIFDYLLPEADQQRLDSRDLRKNGPVIIAGNLSKEKSGYIYNLPASQEFNLYGINYTPNNDPVNIHYQGSFEADELPYALEGSFGLVWDGCSSSTCEGIYGEYLRINNPHKTSLYLASGLPVIIWSQAALADFVERNRCGLSVDSLADIHDKIRQITDAEYKEMLKNTKLIAEQLRSGQFTLDAIKKAEMI